MKAMKRMISMAACLALAASLVSCGNKQNTASVDENGHFTPTKLLELTVWETQGTDYSPSSTVSGDLVEEWLREKTKTTVVNMYGNDGGQWDTKLAKLVAGNNMPDIIHCGAGQGAAHFKKLNEINQIWQLTPELIKTYAPEVWRRVPSEFWDMLTVDGKILGIPYKSLARDDIYPDLEQEEIDFIENLTLTYPTDVTFSETNVFWIRDDIVKKFYPEAKSYEEILAVLDKADTPIGDELLDIPIKSTDEFIDFMYKIKDANIKTNGKTTYAFGYEGGDNWTALTYLGADMYGYKNHNYAGTWNANKQQYEIPLVHDLIRQAAKTQNQMLADSVIDPESLAHTSAQFKEKVLNGQYAICPLFTVDYPDKINQELEERGESFRFRPFITQVPAQKDYPAYTNKALWTDALCLTKSLSEDEVKQVLNWMNVQFTAEYDKVRNWGPEEAGLYEETDDGKLRFKDERFNQYFIEGDAGALPKEEDRLGLQGTGGMMLVVPVNVDHYNAQVMYRKIDLSLPRMNKGLKFPKESKHVQNLPEYPPTAIWSAEYSEVPEVVTFWAKREQWESKFKMALAASPSEFDTKWDQAIADLNNITNISTMEEKCTEIAKGLIQ